MARKFPDLISAYLDWVKNHEGSSRIHRWSIYAIISAALERRVWINRGHYNTYPNLYIFIVGMSGFSKKSTSTGFAVNLLRELPDIKIMSDRLTAGALIEQVKKASKTIQINGVEKTQSSIFCYASELVVLMKEVFGTVTELFTTLWDAPNTFHYNTKHQGDTFIKNVSLTVLAATTFEWLLKSISRTEMNAGFAGRIIFVVEDNFPKRYIAWPDAPLNSDYIKDGLTQDLNSVYSLVGEMKPTKEAREYFSEWYPVFMKEKEICAKSNSIDKNMQGYYARKGEMALKLSMVKSASEGDSLIIEKSHIEWALKELNEIEPEMRQQIYASSTALENAVENKKSVKQIKKEVINFKQHAVDFAAKKASFSKVDFLNEFTGMDLNKLNLQLNELVESNILSVGISGDKTLYHYLPSEKKLQLVT